MSDSEPCVPVAPEERAKPLPRFDPNKPANDNHLEEPEVAS